MQILASIHICTYYAIKIQISYMQDFKTVIGNHYFRQQFFGEVHEGKKYFNICMYLYDV